MIRRSSVGLPFAASLAGHAGVLALLILFLGHAALPLLPVPKQHPGIVVTLAPSAPIAPSQPAAGGTPALPQPQPNVPPPPPVVETTPSPPPPPLPPPVVAAKPPPRPLAPPALPTHRVIVRPPPPQPRRTPQPQLRETTEPVYRPLVAQPQSQPSPPPAAMPSPLPAPPARTAALPPAPRPAAPIVSGSYRAELGAWLASHKRYPDSARERGEEGAATLRFRVARNGQVLSYSLAGSTGHPDLDAAIDQMMRGASLPPFPPDMTANDVEVSVTVRFSLVR